MLATYNAIIKLNISTLTINDKIAKLCIVIPKSNVELYLAEDRYGQYIVIQTSKLQRNA